MAQNQKSQPSKAEVSITMLDNLYSTYKAAKILDKPVQYRLLAEACDKAGIALSQYLRDKAPKAMATAHAEAKTEAVGGFGVPQANSRRGFILRCLFENIWSAADIAEGISACVPGYAEGSTRLYRGKEVLVTKAKNLGAVSGTLQNVRDEGHAVRVCTDGRISIQRRKA